GAAERAAELILAQRRASNAGAVVKEVVGVEYIVTEKLKSVAVILIRARLQSHLDIPPAVAPGRGVIKRSLGLELLHRLRVGQGHIFKHRKVDVVGVDAFELVIIVRRALAVDVNSDGAAPQRVGLE